MRPQQLIKEAFIASILVIVIDLLLSFFSWKFEFIKPIKQGFDDFDIYDLRYAGMAESPEKIDTNITILQLGDSRREIAGEINMVASLHPRIIGLDAVFREPMDSATDSLLIAAINQAKDIVLAADYSYDPSTGKDTIKKSFFCKKDNKMDFQTGFFNFAEGPEDIKRHFIPFHSVNEADSPSFATAILRQISTSAFQRLQARHHLMETINFSGGLHRYNVVTLDQFLSPNNKDSLADYFTDKIVLIGVIRDQQPDVLDDIHFTPMNHKPAGKSFPDSYGAVIHANILEMMMAGSYIREMPAWGVYTLTFLLLLLINCLYIRVLARRRKHSHFLLILFQIVAALFLGYLGLVIFRLMDYKIDLMPIILAVVLSFEIFWLYECLAKQLKKRFGYETFIHD